jgi:hypothetical protein
LKQEERRVLKCIGLKVKEKTRIELTLKEGVSENTSHATYIVLNIYKDGSDTPINLDKAKASQLSLLLGQLVAEGNNIDYEKLKNKYPDQESWHIY